MVEQNQKVAGPGIGPVPNDLRTFPRYSFSATVEAFDAQANIRLVGRISDIARNGCYIDTISPFAEKAIVSLKIALDDKSFKTQGQVAYSQAGMGMGVMFTATEPDQLIVLNWWLSGLRGENPPPLPVPAHEIPIPVSPKKGDRDLTSVLSELVTLLHSKQVDPELRSVLSELTAVLSRK